MYINIYAKTDNAEKILREWQQAADITGQVSNKSFVKRAFGLSRKIRQIFSMGIKIGIISEKPFAVSYTNNIIRNIPASSYPQDAINDIKKAVFKELKNQGIHDEEVTIKHI